MNYYTIQQLWDRLEAEGKFPTIEEAELACEAEGELVDQLLDDMYTTVAEDPNHPAYTELQQYIDEFDKLFDDISDTDGYDDFDFDDDEDLDDILHSEDIRFPVFRVWNSVTGRQWECVMN